MPSIGRVRIPKTAEVIAADIRRQIIRHELKQGDALPNESQLTEQYGVAKPTLREAFRVLEAEALIETRRGSGGAKIKEPDTRVAARYCALVLEHRGVSWADVISTRMSNEASAGRAAALKRTAEHLAILKANVDAATAAHDSSDWSTLARLNTEFHEALMNAAGSPATAFLSEVLSDMIEMATKEWLHSEAGPDAAPAAMKRAVRGHARMVELIEASDGDAAEELWRKHLETAGVFLLERIGGASLFEVLG